jgi:hypothetical protein
LIAALSLLLAGCGGLLSDVGDDDETNGDTDGSSVEDAPSAQITDNPAYNEVEATRTAMNDTGNTYAEATAATLSAAPSFSNWSSWADPGYYSEVDKSGDTWTYTTDTSGWTWTLTVTETSSGYERVVKYDGTDGDGTTYDNWTAFEGSTNADGTSGSYTVYDPEAPDQNRPAFEFSWSGGDRYTWSFTAYDYSSGTPAATDNYDVVIDPDLDGSTGELDLISRDGSDNVTDESKAGWTNQGSAGVLDTGSGAQTWGGASKDNPDNYLSNDEPDA